MTCISTQTELSNLQSRGWHKTASIRKKIEGREYREITLTKNAEPRTCKDGYCYATLKTAAYFLSAPVIFAGSLLACVCDFPTFCDPDVEWSDTPCGQNVRHYNDFAPFCPSSHEGEEKTILVPLDETTPLTS